MEAGALRQAVKHMFTYGWWTHLADSTHKLVDHQPLAYIEMPWRKEQGVYTHVAVQFGNDSPSI